MIVAVLMMVVASLAYSQPPSLDEVAPAEMTATHTPGAFVMVVRGTSIEYAKAFGVANIETGAPVTADTLFEVGSLTKAFTAATLLTLAERKTIDLDATAGKYIDLPPRLAAIPLKSLLSQTSGLRDEPDEFGTEGDDAMGEFVRSWKADDVLLLPSPTFSYSNLGLTLAGAVIERAAHKPYADVVDETVLSSAGMTRSGFRLTRIMTYPVAAGHRTVDGKTTVVRPYAEDSRMWPAGGLFTTANDLARFAIAFLNDGVVDGKRVLSPGVINTMSTPHAAIPALSDIFGRYGHSSYGYGLFVTDDPHVLEHSGANTGFAATLRMFPAQRCAVIVLANGDAFLRRTVERAFAGCLGGTQPPAAAATTPTSIAPSDMAQYEGKYVQPKRWSIEVARKGADLMIKQFGNEFVLSRLSRDVLTFLPPNARAPKQIVFHRDANGSVDALQEDIWAYARVK